MSHTPEPWRTDEYGVLLDSDGKPIIGFPYNTHRIVACVNACAGVSNEWLETEKNIVLLGNPLANRFQELEQQRDELLAAMIDVQQVACSGSPELGIATEAIAKAEAA